MMLFEIAYLTTMLLSNAQKSNLLYIGYAHKLKLCLANVKINTDNLCCVL